MLPLILDLTGRKVVIFGGGPVGARKAAFFQGECRVLVASRSFGREVRGMDVERVKVDLRTASDQDLKDLMEGAFLVIAAVQDPALNNRILSLSRASGILCNSASGDPGRCDHSIRMEREVPRCRGDHLRQVPCHGTLHPGEGGP